MSMSSFQTTPAKEPGQFYLNNGLFDGTRRAGGLLDGP